ncbi:hypothetical protein RhiJN_12964 [Ceratobasidium sp. AG-Ba]|nr:hypothetical protein RhiJN_12964 [Ceratobasidium sp. AG-Ba]
MEDLKSPTCSSKSGSPDIGAPPLGSPPSIDLGAMNEPDPSNDRHRAHIRTYHKEKANCEPAPINEADYFRRRLRNVFEFDNAVDHLIPGSPIQMIPPDSESWVEDPGYIEARRLRSVSAVPSMSDMPLRYSLAPTLPQLVTTSILRISG